MCLSWGDDGFRRKDVLKHAPGLSFPSADLTSDVFLSFSQNNRKYTERRNNSVQNGHFANCERRETANREEQRSSLDNVETIPNDINLKIVDFASDAVYAGGIHAANCSETNLLIKNNIIQRVIKRAALIGELFASPLCWGSLRSRRIRRRTLLGLIASPSVAKLLMMLVKKHSSPK